MPLKQDQIDALKAEIQNDPAGMGYAGKTAAEVWDLLCTSKKTKAADTTTTRAISKAQAVASCPALLDAEVSARKSARVDGGERAATFLAWFDAGPIDYASETGTRVAGLALEADVIATLAAACTVAVLGGVAVAASRRSVLFGDDPPMGALDDVAKIVGA